MPRKSSAALTIPRVDGRPGRLRPPSGLPKAARVVFEQVVGAMAPEHFNPGDLTLLIRYCEAATLAERAAKELRVTPVLGVKINPWLIVLEKADRSLATLALRLRICPQSRENQRSTTRRVGGLPPSIIEQVREQEANHE